MKRKIEIPVEALEVRQWEDGIEQVKPHVESLGYKFISLDHYSRLARIFYITIEDNND
ncbi:MAG: hypothetical protein R3321_00080 [Nitrososphaeraceae archaeon]|nr:hypothetical protein [Nitrososphaeraceae archaeon]